MTAQYDLAEAIANVVNPSSGHHPGLTRHDRTQLAGRWARKYPEAMIHSPYLRDDERAACQRRIEHRRRERERAARRQPPAVCDKTTWNMTALELAWTVAAHYRWQLDKAGQVVTAEGQTICPSWDHLAGLLIRRGWVVVGRGIDWRAIGERPDVRPLRQDRIGLVPVSRDAAVAFVDRVHRHHQRPHGYRFAVGAHDGTCLVGVALAGRPVARHLDDGWTLEVTRIATDGTPNACSALLGACWRAARALGYTRAYTYTQEGESGVSLRAAGWTLDAELPARAGWDSPSRPRQDRGTDQVRRYRWKIATPEHGKLDQKTLLNGPAEQRVTRFGSAGIGRARA